MSPRIKRRHFSHEDKAIILRQTLIVQSTQGYRPGNDPDQQLAHELFEILRSGRSRATDSLEVDAE